MTKNIIWYRWLSGNFDEKYNEQINNLFNENFNGIITAFMLILVNVIIFLLEAAAVAQITPDRTLGSEQSTLNRNVTINNRNSDRIEGGARRGANLFHSFERFNVNNGQRLYFANPAGVVNILGRVTGQSRSRILGTLGVEGNANLFLMNPNGIVFGRNATLDVRGSFVATTANRMQFGSQGFFETDNPQALPLLTVSPSALLFNQIAPGRIQTQSVADAGQNLAGSPLLGLRVPDGQNLLLIGGEVAVEGGLHALGGQLGVIAAAAPATVALSADPRPSVQQLSSVSGRANVLIHAGALLDVSANQGGEILIQARDLRIRGGSTLQAGIDQNLGSRGNQAGDIILDAVGNVEISNSDVLNLVEGTGTGGDLLIRGRSLTLDGGSTLAASTLSQGNAGRVVIQADSVIFTEDATVSNTIEPGAVGTTGGIFLESNSLTLTNGSAFFGNTSGRGDVGDIVIRVRDHVRLSGNDAENNPSGIFNLVSPGAGGDAGEIDLGAGSLSMTNGAVLRADTLTQGNGGDVKVRVSGRLRLDGTANNGFPSGIFAVVEADGLGNGGSIDIQADSLTLSNGAQLITDTFGRGDAGNITVQVRDRLFIDGSATDLNDALSGIFTAVNRDAVGDAGNIDIQAGSLTLLNGAQLLAATFGRGDAGNITVQVRDRAIFDDFNNAPVPSGAFSIVSGSNVAAPAVGNGGDIHISANQIVLRNAATFGASVEFGGQGNAGRISITATDHILIEGARRNGELVGGIFTRVALGADGNANDIQITANRLTLSNDGTIQASIGSDGRAGNVQINSRIVEVLSGGQLLTTTASGSRAGDINFRVNDHITVSGENSGLLASTERNAAGQGGDINLITSQLTVSDRAEITVSSPTGRAGNLTIAANQIRLDRGRLTAEAGVGTGAEITLQELDSLFLQNNSLISAQASDNAMGGNVTVNVSDGLIVAVPEQNSDIIASAEQGRGGNITISAQGIFNIEPQQSIPQNQTNDIDASSQFNQSGTVTINQPDIDPSRGLIELPAEVVDRAAQIARGCAPRDSESGRFVATGRGGLPLSPDQPLRDRAILLPDWITLDADIVDPAVEQRQQNQESVEPIDISANINDNYSINIQAEASEFGRDVNGKIMLVAQSQSNNAVAGNNLDCFGQSQ